MFTSQKHFVDLFLCLQDKEKKVAGLDRIFYALEVFSENLGKDLIPYLEEILKRLLQLITPQFSNHVQVSFKS